MYILRFFHSGKDYFLHDGTTFVGVTENRDVQNLLVSNMAKQLSVVGMMNAFEVKTVEDLSRMVGGSPYKIIDFVGGLIPFMGVEIINE